MTPCIESTRTPSQFYPQVYVGGTKRVMQEHRLVWTEANGPIPNGMLVCHHCDNPRCVRLDHLYLGTPKDNMADRSARGRHANQRKTHCPRGHEYTPANTIAGKGTQGRKCRTCHNDARRVS